MKEYVYRDHNNDDRIVFACFAEDIMEADAQYTLVVGNTPVKHSNVGCEIIKEGV